MVKLVSQHSINTWPTNIIIVAPVIWQFALVAQNFFKDHNFRRLHFGISTEVKIVPDLLI